MQWAGGLVHGDWPGRFGWARIVCSSRYAWKPVMKPTNSRWRAWPARGGITGLVLQINIEVQWSTSLCGRGEAWRPQLSGQCRSGPVTIVVFPSAGRKACRVTKKVLLGEHYLATLVLSHVLLVTAIRTENTCFILPRISKDQTIRRSRGGEQGG